MLPKYFNDYTVANIAAMVRNNRRNPLRCEQEFTDRLVVITGATAGIGYLTALKFASMGARLLCINRNEAKSKALKAEIERDYKVSCNYLTCDMGLLNEVRSCVDQLKQINDPMEVLVHNAGVHLTRRELSPEGFDKVFVVNHLSSFMINLLLADKLREQEAARIILVNSEGHRFAPWGLRLDDLDWEKRRYSGLKSYGSAKLAQLLSMRIFAEQFSGSGVRINAMHPGAVRSDTGKENGALYRWTKKHLFDKMLRPTDIASESIYYLGVSGEVADVSGRFFNLTTLEDPAPPAMDMEAARELWERSLEMCAL